MFTAIQNKGFQMTFENGITISVQWGTGNYCEHRIGTMGNGIEGTVDVWESKNAELAVWDDKGNDYKFTDGHLEQGWVTPDEVAEWITKVSRWKDINGF